MATSRLYFGAKQSKAIHTQATTPLPPSQQVLQGFVVIQHPCYQNRYQYLTLLGLKLRIL